MQLKTKTIWCFTIEFLQTFAHIYYDRLPISLLLLRDFQKFTEKNLSKIDTRFIKRQPESSIQKACEPYLLKSRPKQNAGGYILARADLYPLTKNSKQSYIYLAHHKNEYKRMLRHKQCRPLYNLSSLPEKKLPVSEAKRVMQELNRIFKNRQTPALYRKKYFCTWMRKTVKKLLVSIRKLHTLFEKYPISKTLYGSTINRHGVLVTTFAQSRHICTINFQHGILGDIGHLPLNADMNLVWGKSHQKFLEFHGAPKEKIKIVPPYFPKSHIHQKSSPPPSRRISTPPNKHSTSAPYHVLVALQPLGEAFNTKMIRDIETAVRPYAPNIRIHYKLHPDQNASTYKPLLSSIHSRIHQHGSTSLQQLITLSDFMITHSSAAAYEALLSNKPVYYYSKPKPIYYLKSQPQFINNQQNTKRLFMKLISTPGLVLQPMTLNDHLSPVLGTYNIDAFI
ncbi:hypothetical protein [Thalassobacillus sp. CUG 92003]|uniref:hypothetical protein n=1 Tax=Thalassobacillus sp. CUG 92003 TaxID=2736641 RepID=UPI0015E6F3EF|nr:hypothetical protein [Thalassobacillus sp. CUG 92003]